MGENEIFIIENEIFMHENENAGPKKFMGEDFMHEVVYSPTAHENHWDEKIMPGAKLLFSCMKNIFMPQFFHARNFLHRFMTRLKKQTNILCTVFFFEWIDNLSPMAWGMIIHL